MSRSGGQVERGQALSGLGAAEQVIQRVWDAIRVEGEDQLAGRPR